MDRGAMTMAARSAPSVAVGLAATPSDVDRARRARRSRLTGVAKAHSTRRVGCELGDTMARRALAQDTTMSVHR